MPELGPVFMLNSRDPNAAPPGAALPKFQQLLSELFQFDAADLDFGIYRIMNHKRDAIRRFIDAKLPAAVNDALGSGPLANQSGAAAALDDAAQQVRANLGHAAIDVNGALAEQYHSLPLGQRYLDAQAAASAGNAAAGIYNHLYQFFRRYYQDGDFISQRRYSRRHRYAIPYNGQEVYLHWANRDQYYVKSDAHFRNYDWNAPNGVAVHFRLDNANVEQNNVKGETRFFLPLSDQAHWDDDARTITIPFEYRPLTADEKTVYKTRYTQDNIIAHAVAAIPQTLAGPTAAAALAALNGEHRRNARDAPVSRLEHHLRRYAARNNSDFFIHQDLAGFLNRELDFYLKNEVLNLDDLTRAGTDLAEGWFQTLRLVKSIGAQIIDFLAQIEDFQKTLWEKRKFVTATHYAIALGCIDPALYHDIAANNAQWQEWQTLHNIDGSDRTPAFLRAHPTLMLDTRHCDAVFTDRILAAFNDLDGITDGLLLHGDNWQALNLMAEKYAGQVKCIYIDPPYNTGGKDDGFLYKDNYQHSTWLSMMDGLMPANLNFLTDSGSFVSHIDEHEFNRFDQLVSLRFGADQNVGPVIWDKRNPKGDATGIASQHEYLCWAVKDYDVIKGNKNSLSRKKENARAIISKADELVRLNEGVSDDVRDEFRAWLNKQDFAGGEKAYSRLDDDGAVYRPVSMAWPNTSQAPEQYFIPLLHPVSGKPCPVPARGWRNSPQTMANLLADGMILFGPDETTQPQRKYLLRDNMTENVPSLYYFGGSDADLQKDYGYSFPNPKPLRMADYIIPITAPGKDAIVLDYFAGSGTTAHAVINLNREDGGRRKFILVEMGQYFDTVLLPRIKKAVYTPEWRNGQPRRAATPQEAERSPRIIKYQTLESYEDALDSIEFEPPPAGQPPLEEILGDEYLLKYMLPWETKGSATLLNAGQLTGPFSYRLRVHSNGAPRERTVDLPETFNWLLGLKVTTRRAYRDRAGRRYLVYRGATRERPGHPVTVIWRDTAGWTARNFFQDRELIADLELDDAAETVYINGGAVIPGTTALEPLFKARMFAAVNG